MQQAGESTPACCMNYGGEVVPAGRILQGIEINLDEFSLSRQALDLTDNHDDLSPDLNHAGIVDHDWFHSGICWLEADATVLQVEVLEGRLVAIVQPDRDHVAVARFFGWFHNDDVTVVDHGVDHRISLDFQGKQTFASFSRRQLGPGDVDHALRIVVCEV